MKVKYLRGYGPETVLNVTSVEATISTTYPYLELFTEDGQSYDATYFNSDYDPKLGTVAIAGIF